MIIPVILAGGSGTRLWPLSRELYPKQLIDLYNDDTMIQNTILRLDGVEDLGGPVVICNEEHRFMTAEQLRKIDKTPFGHHPGTCGQEYRSGYRPCRTQAA